MYNFIELLLSAFTVIRACNHAVIKYSFRVQKDWNALGCCDRLLSLSLPSSDNFSIIDSTNHFVLIITNASKCLQTWHLRNGEAFFLKEVFIFFLPYCFGKIGANRHERRPVVHLLSAGLLYRCI